MLNASDISNGSISIQIGPSSNLQASFTNGILNGLEVMKMSNSADSLDGLFSADGTYRGIKSGLDQKMKAVAGIGLALGGVSLVLLVLMIVRWKEHPKAT